MLKSKPHSRIASCLLLATSLALPSTGMAVGARNNNPPPNHPGDSPTLHEGAETRARLGTAAALLADHRFEEARALLQPARGRFGLLEPWAALLLGEALAGLGRAEEALPLLDEAARANPEGPLGRRAEVPAALALAHAGKVQPARQRLEALLSSRRGPAATLRLTLARALEAAGDAGAKAHYLQLWRDHPDLPEGALAAARLAALQVRPTAQDRLERVERLLDRGHATTALAELKGLEGEKAKLALLEARALSGAERKPEAEKALLPALAAEAPAAIRFEALELASRLAMRREAVDEALPHLRRLEREAKGNRAREAAFLASFFLYDAGRFAEAEKAFRAFSAKYPTGRRADEGRWYTAWSLYKQAQYPAAATELAALVEQHPKSSLVDQALYWQGRAQERAGAKGAAIRLYRQAVERDPLGWYALLGRGRLAALGQESPPPKAPRRFAARTASLKKWPATTRARLARAEALYAAGLAAEADEELQAALSGKRDRELDAFAARLASEGGNHHRAFQLGLFRLGGLSGAADLAFPPAYAAEVEEAGRNFGVDPHFVWSIMRQESGFRPAVRSPAAAVGLMQILPVTAERIAGLLRRPLAEAGRLEDPRVNVTYGTWYLAQLLERFDGSRALAAAAYNAGPGAVARWMAEPARKDLPLDEFVESIPYRETRHYVKKVLANLQTYRLVHGGAPLVPGEKLPELKAGIDF